MLKGRMRTVLLILMSLVLAGSVFGQGSETRMEAFLQRVAAFENGQEGYSNLNVFLKGTPLIYEAHELDRLEDCRRLSTTVIRAWSLSWKEGQAWTRNQSYWISILGIYSRFESSFENGGRIGEGWQRQREMTDLWRSFVGLEAEAGAMIVPSEVGGVAGDLRGYGWRLVDREAAYLDRCGRTPEALRLVEAALTLAGGDLTPGTPEIPRFYASKLLSRKADILDMIGYEDQAIKVVDQLIGLLTEAPEDNRRLVSTRINRLKMISDWRGATPELVEEARAIADEAAAHTGKRDAGVERVVANLEMALQTDREDIEALQELAHQQRETGFRLEAFMSERDALFWMADADDPALYERFEKTLKEARSQGNYHAEPRLFRRYGDYLMGRERFSEAVSSYRNGLERVQRFGWISWEPALRVKLASALWRAGRADEAHRVLAELEAWYLLHPEVSKQRRVSAEISRIWLLAAMGDFEKARAVVEEARKLGREAGLSAQKMRYLDEVIISEMFAAAGQSAAPIRSEDEGGMTLTPVLVNTQALIGEQAVTRYYLIPRGIHQSGRFLVSGPGAKLLPVTEQGGASLGFGASFAFTPGESEQQVELPVEVGTGMMFPVDLVSGPAEASLEAKLVWQSSVGEQTQAQWNVAWGESWGDTLVLEAATSTASPYHPIPVLHTVRLPSKNETTTKVAFRVTSPVPLRIEYREASSGRLIAVDDNGNGVFTEKGDLYPADAIAKGMPAAAILPVPPESKTIPVEVWVSGVGATSSQTGEPCNLSVELYDGSRWIGAATDSLDGVK